MLWETSGSTDSDKTAYHRFAMWDALGWLPSSPQYVTHQCNKKGTCFMCSCIKLLKCREMS